MDGFGGTMRGACAHTLAALWLTWGIEGLCVARMWLTDALRGPLSKRTAV